MVDFAKMLQQRREGNQAPTPTSSQTRVTISIAGADYAIKYPKNDKLTEALKNAVPQGERNWHRTQYVWLVSPEEIESAIKAMQPYTSQTINLPEVKPGAPEVIEKTFQLDYLGATRDRGKRKSAYGSVNGDWSAEFSEEVLKKFFEGEQASQSSDGLQTLYQVLCVMETVTPEQIKSAYRRLARQWHPDVCKEPDAADRFREIDAAYKTLSNPEQRKRYDAGLYFERQDMHGFGAPAYKFRYDTYRAPLRCGLITARGTVRLMRFVVSEILKWDDVINAQGQTMVSSWPKGGETFSIQWV
jgi:hypothetical protein